MGFFNTTYNASFIGSIDFFDRLFASKVGCAFFDERFHALLLVLGGECGVEMTTFKAETFLERCFVRDIDCLLA